MNLKYALLFIVVSGLDGLCILLGSIVGNGIFGRRGLFAGAIVGGIVGLVVALLSAVRLGLLDRHSYGVAFIGGVIGFLFAAVIAVNNLRGPIVPVMSTGLVGLGVILGMEYGRQRAANK
jgi:hypothetical protein